MMGFFNKVKKALGSKKEDVESQDSVNDEVIAEPTFTESIENNEGTFNDDEKIKSKDSEATLVNEEVIDNPFPDKIRNFKYLDYLIHSGGKEIVLDSDIALDDDESSKYKDGIKLDTDDLIVDGKGHTIDAKDKTRIFECLGKNVRIKNMTLTHGRAIWGGAILNRNDLAVEEIRIIDNSSNRTGGAINNYGGSLSVIKSDFTNNSAVRVGGAINNFQGDLTVIESSFNGNEAKINAGAIHNHIGNIVISKSIFRENHANDIAGALNNFKGKCTITESEFYKNHSGRDGAGINNTDGRMNITVSSFIENSAKYGGGIDNRGQLSIKDTLFSKNTSEWNGGAIYNRRKLIITKAIFIENKGIQGGAIYDRGELSIAKSKFLQNTAETGGIIYHYNGKLSIIESVFSKNISRSEDIEGGGAIFQNGGDSIIIKSSFNENIVDNGVIYNFKGYIKLQDVQLYNNDYVSLNDIYNLGFMFLAGKFSFNPKAIHNEGRIVTSIDNYNNQLPQMFELKLLNKDQRDFTYLNELIHRGTKEIKLENDIILDMENDEYEKFKKGIKIDSDDLVIDGNGHTIDAQYSTRIFYCMGKNITIKNITLKNGYVYDSLEMIGEGCGYTESVVVGGGAVYNKGELKIIKSTISNNTALGKYDSGGAIFNDGKLNIVETMINENKANNSGGAIVNHGNMNIIKSELNENTANELGGVVFNGAELNILESTLNNNILDEVETIYNINGNLKIFNCEISSNVSKKSIILNKDSLQIYNTTFRDNNARFTILNCDNEANLSISGGEFLEKNIGESILYNNGKFCTIEKTIFENNISNNSINIINKSELTLINLKLNDNEKTILNEKNILIKKSSPELENTIYGVGTVENIEERIPQGENFDFGYLDEKIHESNTKEIILDHDITFNNYEIDFYEGGIELDIDNLIIDGNGHAINGLDKSRVFIITGKNITLKNIIFKNGHSHKNYNNPLNNNGGAIKINHNINMTIENCEFINNASEEYGGAIHNSECSLTITESTFIGNTAKMNGGAIYNEDELIIKKSEFNENTSDKSGGVICNHHGILTILESIFTKNMSKLDGGVIYNEDELIIKKSEFNENLSNIFGGVITNRMATSIISESAFKKNTGKSGGGAIKNSEGEVTITKSIFDENTTDLKGGAICNDGRLIIIKSEFIKNSSLSNGGAIDHFKGEVRITKSIICNNASKWGSGGGISNSDASSYFDGKISIIGSTLKKNTANKFGGAIYLVRNFKLNIVNSTLTENRASRNGGAICLEESKKYKSENCTFKDNEPGDIYEKKD